MTHVGLFLGHATRDRFSDLHQASFAKYQQLIASGLKPHDGLSVRSKRTVSRVLPRWTPCRLRCNAEQAGSEPISVTAKMSVFTSEDL